MWNIERRFFCKSNTLPGKYHQATMQYLNLRRSLQAFRIYRLKQQRLPPCFRWLRHGMVPVPILAKTLRSLCGQMISCRYIASQ